MVGTPNSYRGDSTPDAPTDSMSMELYQRLIKSVDGLSEGLGLDVVEAQTLREFILNVAKENFREGNKAGIRWAYSQTEKKLSTGSETKL